MKNIIRISAVLVLIILVLSCKKEDNVIKDIDGNVYTSVIIGTQVWMVENLKTTKFYDGTAIPNVTDDNEWAVLASPAYCWYNNDEATNAAAYGALYNWYAVDNAKLCPNGWHVPSDSEWTTLEDYLTANGYNYDGSKAGNKFGKALASSSGWNVSLTEGSVGNTDYSIKRNASGFTGLPGGVRDANERMFGSIGNFGLLWSSSEESTNLAWDRGIDYSLISLGRGNVNKNHGMSVRCLHD